MLDPWKKSYDQPRQHIKKQRHYFANKGLSSQSYGFSSSHVWMWESDYRESWALKNRCFWNMALEKILENPLNGKEIQPVHPKGNQSWIFIVRTDAEAEAPVLWPHQASLSITNSWSLLKLMSIMSVMPSNQLILCHPLLLLPSVFPRIRVFSNESALRIRWPKYWSFSFSINPSNQHSGLISLGWTGWISLQSKGLSRVFSNTTVQKHQFFHTQLSL